MSDAPTATDAAVKLADEHGVDLATVTPTGASGIVVADVEAAIARTANGEGTGGYPPASPSDASIALRKGTYTVDAPDYLGGVRVTVRAGEPVPPALAAHIPEADRADLFAPHGADEVS